MENGYDRRLEEKFSGMKLGLGHDPSSSSAAALSESAAENPNDSLFQVMKAVEAAEATIKQQVEENNRLRLELQNRNLLIEKLKLDESMSQRHSDESLQNPPERMKQDSDVSMAQNLSENRFEGGKMMNGTIKGQQTADSAGFSSPSTGSFSPRRLAGEHDQRLNSGQGLMPITELNHQNSLWKQDLGHKVHEHEEEIMLLRKHLADYSIKEAQIRNEKHVLEKRIAYMRLAFDQQQQDLVDAASKALSYRQDIIEENIRLTYALQDAQQERSTFVSSLLPLLAEYSLQPPVIDAQSIVSNVKVLFKHLQEKLLLTETKLKESQYQLTPWRADVSQPNIATHSTSHPIGTALANSNTNGLELVPQPVYSQGKAPEPNADAQPAAELDLWVRQQPPGVSGVAQNLEHDDVGRYSPIPSSHASLAQDMPTQETMSRGPRYGEEMANKQVTFRDPVTNTEMEDRDGEGNQNEREAQANWSSANPPYSTSMDDPSSSYSPFLPPVLEEPSSSFSEAADDDPLPAIEGLQIAGEAYPGRELQASGYSINGTTSCNFEWVRYLEDGSVNYIEGAKQPNYLVTADDVDTYLALEVQPLDNRKRKGELVKVFANENRKITFDPEMQNHIEKSLHSGRASYKVSMSTIYLDIWEQAILEVKREACSIKCTGASGLVITEKFSPTTTVAIPYGTPTEFVITGSGEVQHILKVDDESDISRDTVVVILRLFIMRAGERRKAKKRSLFFSK